MVTLVYRIWFGQFLVPLHETPPTKYYLHVLIFHVVFWVSVLWFEYKTAHSDMYLSLGLGA